MDNEMFKILYTFLFDTIKKTYFVVEIKRLDVPDNSPANIKYHWLKIDIYDNNIDVSKLEFISMDTNVRLFDNYYLSFDNSKASFIQNNENIDNLVRLNNDYLFSKQSICDAIKSYFIKN
jgi:hypothetical protein